MTNTNVAFVDCETTGLHPDLHEIWEVGLILPDGTEHNWFLPVDLGRADPFALSIGRFHERHPEGYKYPRDFADIERWAAMVTPEHFAREVGALTRGLHLAGAVVSFDAERLAKLLRANGACPEWHYHLIDVEALAVGYVAGCYGKTDRDLLIPPPWKSDELTEALGITVPEEDKHTALGDARWAKAIYEAVMGA